MARTSFVYAVGIVCSLPLVVRGSTVVSFEGTLTDPSIFGEFFEVGAALTGHFVYDPDFDPVDVPVGVSTEIEVAVAMKDGGIFEVHEIPDSFPAIVEPLSDSDLFIRWDVFSDNGPLYVEPVDRPARLFYLMASTPFDAGFDELGPIPDAIWSQLSGGVLWLEFIPMGFERRVAFSLDSIQAVSIQSVPEPTTRHILMVGLALVGAWGRWRRRLNRAA